MLRPLTHLILLGILTVGCQSLPNSQNYSVPGLLISDCSPPQEARIRSALGEVKNVLYYAAFRLHNMQVASKPYTQAIDASTARTWAALYDPYMYEASLGWEVTTYRMLELADTMFRNLGDGAKIEILCGQSSFTRRQDVPRESLAMDPDSSTPRDWVPYEDNRASVVLGWDNLRQMFLHKSFELDTGATLQDRVASVTKNGQAGPYTSFIVLNPRQWPVWDFVVPYDASRATNLRRLKNYKGFDLPVGWGSLRLLGSVDPSLFLSAELLLRLAEAATITAPEQPLLDVSVGASIGYLDKILPPPLPRGWERAISIALQERQLAPHCSENFQLLAVALFLNRYDWSLGVNRPIKDAFMS